MASIEFSYKNFVRKVAANIKKARKAKKYSQKKMEKFGFDLRNYQRIESGEHSPSLYTLFKVAKALEIEVSDLTD